MNSSSVTQMFDPKAFIAGYPGAALVMQTDGTVIVANEKGQALKSLLKSHSMSELESLLTRSALTESVIVEMISIPLPDSDIVMELTVSPMGFALDGGEGGSTFAVLGRDLTMERNLRSALVESRQRYKDLVEVSSDFSWETAIDGTFAFVTPKGALGFSAEELVGRNPADFVINPEDYAPIPFLAEKPLDEVELWMRRANGSMACVVASALPMLDDAGTWRGTRGVCRDVTEEREREQALNAARHREQLLNYVVSTIRDEVEPGNMLTAAATATARALGAEGCVIYRLDPVKGFVVAAEFGAACSFDDASDFIAGLDGLAEGETLAEEIGELEVLGAATHYRQATNGAICLWQCGTKSWEPDHHILIGDVANQLGIANEQITNHERILTMSRTDAMTGMLNRRAFFEEELPRRLQRLERDQLGAALMYVDMDNFKRVNDVHGHQAGDEAIMTLRDLLEEYSRPGDVMARLGGDEFAVWLDAIPDDIVPERAEDLIKASQLLKKFSGDENHPLGISIGVAIYNPKSEETLDGLVHRADEAMYQVKNSGKGGYHIASAADQSISPGTG